VVPIELGNMSFVIGTTGRSRAAWFRSVWVALLIGEVIGLSYSFDINTPAIATHPSPFVRWVASSSVLIRLGMCLGAVTATMAVASVTLRQELGGIGQLTSRSIPSYWSALAHLVAYVAFFRTTGLLIDGMSGWSTPYLPLLFWMSLGATTFATWLQAAMPLALWLRMLGRAWKVVLAGILIGLLALAFGHTTGQLWEQFHGWTFRAASGLLRAIDPDVICSADSLDLGIRGFKVNIAPECSGFEGIGLIWAFLGGYLALFRRELRFPQALLLLPVGTIVIWLLNVLRIVGLVLLGSCGWPEVALGGFHSQAGWLAFNLVGLGLVAASRQMGFFTKDQSSGGTLPNAISNPTALYLGPLLAVIATTMITGTMSDGVLDRFYAVRVVAALASLWICRRAFTGTTWSWSWSAVGIGALVFLVWMILEPTGDAAQTATLAIRRGLLGMSSFGAMFWMAARLLGAIVTVPVVEELAFRGYLMRRLIDADFESVPFTRWSWASLLISSVCFGVMHQRWLAGTIAGLFYALAVHRRGQLSDGIAAHATTNVLIALSVLLTGTWSLLT
jgi:exosortase E/protease (VPEID-CTERM system)